MKKQKIIVVICCCLIAMIGLVMVGIFAGAGKKEAKAERETKVPVATEENTTQGASLIAEDENEIAKSGPDREMETEHVAETVAEMEAESAGTLAVEKEMETPAREKTGHLAGEEPQENEYAGFAIADVSNYVNVRREPTTDSNVVGKMYDGAVAEILAVTGDEEEWFQITSGSVEGYIKAEFFISGQDAVAVMDEYVSCFVKVEADRLNVRKEASTDQPRIGYIDYGEKVKLLEDCGEWLRVQYTDEKEGYVASEYVTILEEYMYAKTLEEEQAELQAMRELKERESAKEEEASENITNVSFPETAYTSSAELRQTIVNYALQYVGYPYVSGGRSLATGTDCSGFTCFVYADFGYSISRTPGGQYSSSGRSIDYGSIQPGDIICYSSNGGASCTHVGLYIGNGQIVHAANSRKGVITQNADYDLIIGIKNVID